MSHDGRLQALFCLETGSGISPKRNERAPSATTSFHSLGHPCGLPWPWTAWPRSLAVGGQRTGSWMLAGTDPLPLSSPRALVLRQQSPLRVFFKAVVKDT